MLTDRNYFYPHPPYLEAVELVLNALFNKDSEEREFTLMVFNPKFLAKGGWIFWLMIGLWLC